MQELRHYNIFVILTNCLYLFVYIVFITIKHETILPFESQLRFGEKT
jgi:hypothetical protein